LSFDFVICKEIGQENVWICQKKHDDSIRYQNVSAGVVIAILS